MMTHQHGPSNAASLNLLDRRWLCGEDMCGCKCFYNMSAQAQETASHEDTNLNQQPSIPP
jgi:hypothetical protein